jgi:ribosomal protein S12 methylthiotransferase accessory factor
VAVRPTADLYDENITVYNGKGLTKIQAKVSALMEAFERDGGERHDRPTLYGSYDHIQKYGRIVHPEKLILPKAASYQSTEMMEWVPGRDLMTGDIFYVPAGAVFFPYRPRRSAKFLYGFSDTNGLASGNTVLEATAYALSEVIERDVEKLSFLRRKGSFIDLKSFEHPLILIILEKFQNAGINLYLKDITSEFKIPSYVAAIDDPITQNPLLLARGIGTHVDPEIAVIRALTEAAQSRCTFISGHREDLTQDDYKKQKDYQKLKEEMEYWFGENPKKSFKIPAKREKTTMVQDVITMLEAVAKKGFHRAIVVNLTRPELGVPVVRVIVPGLEPIMGSIRSGRRAGG